jgi:carbon-monoxide dehydrogenase medium subunit
MGNYYQLPIWIIACRERIIFQAMKVENLVTACTHNDLGVKGCGEAGAIASPPAVINAVVDALSPLGVTDITMPATPQKGLAGHSICANQSSRIRRRSMYSTKYVKAKDIDDAATIMASAEDGKFLAGGMTLIPTLKQRLANPDCLVDLSACGLSAIDDEGGAIRIGAMTRHVDVAESALVQKAIPAVADLAGHIGDRQVRNCGTIGGSLANNDPAACYPAALLALGGTVHTQNRSITAEDYFDGMFETTLEDGEVIRDVSLPKPEKAAYVKFPNPASRYAMVGVFVAKFADGVRVAVTGAGEDGVFRASNLEAALDANFSADAIADGTVSADGLDE